jgi:hypothetical protein
MDFEDALLEKRVIEFAKKSKEEVLDFCKDFGYNPSSLRNAAQRREALTRIFKEQNGN